MWKDIKDFEGYYQVSDDGQVRSVDRILYQKNGHPLSYKSHIMKQTLARNGYYVVNLRNGTKTHATVVHRLVAEAFIPNPSMLPTVNHIDGNKLNNTVSNLEWVSYRDNNVHALVHNLRKPKKGIPVVHYDKDGKFVAIYNSSIEASKATGYNVCSISHCLTGLQDHVYDGSKFVRYQEGVTTIPQGSTSDVVTDGSASGLI